MPYHPSEMPLRRYLCSDLVTLRSPAGEFTVNLEEIWETGAVVECEQEPPTGAPVQIRTDQVRLSGSVCRTESHEFGWRAEITFSPLTPWRIEVFRPAHLLDIAETG
jgi:hypothetical protein